ncbi:MAG: YbhB/YbcL family Raf kinase inhibitor-like protein [Actinomycetota bacterium]
MDLFSTSFVDGGKVPTRCALAIPADPGPVEFAGNKNPNLSWSGAPEATRSYVITCIDHDCPSAPDDVNQPDREVPSSLPRVDFTHWLVANVPADVTSIDEGSHSDGVTARGKTAESSPDGVHGLNDYTSWFAGDPDLDGEWNGYDGSAPPWNDSIPHHYEFTVYALDVDALDLAPGFTRDDLATSMEGHVLDAASITGLYALNPRLH